MHSSVPVEVGYGTRPLGGGLRRGRTDASAWVVDAGDASAWVVDAGELLGRVVLGGVEEGCAAGRDVNAGPAAYCGVPTDESSAAAERLSPSERTLRARIAVNASWARTVDRSARTAPARRAAMQRYEREIDPDGTLDPGERARRAEYAMRAHMSRLALRSVRARRQRRG
jgi:hypothetical protein